MVNSDGFGFGGCDCLKLKKKARRFDFAPSNDCRWQSWPWIRVRCSFSSVHVRPLPMCPCYDVRLLDSWIMKWSINKCFGFNLFCSSNLSFAIAMRIHGNTYAEKIELDDYGQPPTQIRSSRILDFHFFEIFDWNNEFMYFINSELIRIVK